jgi:hypothetical protein
MLRAVYEVNGIMHVVTLWVVLRAIQSVHLLRAEPTLAPEWIGLESVVPVGLVICAIFIRQRCRDIDFS